MNTAEPTRPYVRMDRRTAIKWFMVAGMSLAMPPGRSSAAPGSAGGGLGYGRDPNMFEAEVPWPRTLSPEQLQLTSALADIVVPYSSAASPAASAVHVPDFIDEWISAPYPRQQRDRTIILAGLARVDALSANGWNNTFLQASPDQQTALCAALAGEAVQPSVTPADRTFFRLFTVLVLGGYYTSEAGLKDIGYVGNVPLPSFPGPPPEVLRRIGVETTPW